MPNNSRHAKKLALITSGGLILLLGLLIVASIFQNQPIETCTDCHADMRPGAERLPIDHPTENCAQCHQCDRETTSSTTNFSPPSGAE